MANTYTGVEFSENTLIGFLGLKSLEKAKDWNWKTLNPPSYCHPPRLSGNFKVKENVIQGRVGGATTRGGGYGRGEKRERLRAVASSSHGLSSLTPKQRLPVQDLGWV